MNSSHSRLIVIFIATLHVVAGCKVGEPATPEQQAYLPNLLADTKNIVIQDGYGTNIKVIAAITEPDEISAFVASTRISRMDIMCACKSTLNINFISRSGKTNVVNFSRHNGHITYANPWGRQAPIPQALELLVGNYVKAETSPNQSAHGTR